MAVALRAHPPERRRRPTAVAACGCCCCCCCLHSVVGLLAPAITERSETVEEQKGTAAYWLCLLALVGATFAAFLAASDPGPGSLLMVAIFLPAFQLVAALAAAVIGHFVWGPGASRRVLRLAWRAFVGGLIGLGIMAAPIYGMSGSSLGAGLSALGVFVVVWLCITFRKGARHAE